MAAIFITYANVLAAPGANIIRGISGDGIPAGAPIYQDRTASNALKLCRANAAETARCDGIALNTAFPGQPLAWLPSGYDITIGGTVVVGEVYCVSPTISLMSGTMPMGSGPNSITGLTPFDDSMLPGISLAKLVDVSAGTTHWNFAGFDGADGEIDLTSPIGFSVQADVDTFDIYGGAIVPIGDLTTGDYVTILGIATTETTITLDIDNGGVAKP